MNTDKILERYSRLKGIRDGYWLDAWREVRQYVYPSYSDHRTEGGVRGQEIFDTTAIEARKRLAAGMYNWLAPPDKRWFELVAQNEDLAKDEDVKRFFAEVTSRIAFAMANSNWPSTLIQVLNNLACGLDATIYIEDGGPGQSISFRSYPVETVCFAENARGEVDTLFREYDMTARQMRQQFEDGLPEEIAAEAKSDSTADNVRKVLHVIMPRPVRNEDMADAKNMPWADLYIDMKTRRTVFEGGHDEQPFAVCHFEKSDNETYGRGPGMDKLPDIKMLNRMRQAYIVAAEHQADPSYLVPDGSLVDRDFNRDPGSLVVYKAGLDGAKPEVLPQTANLARAYQDIEEERAKIREGFYWDIFDPLGNLKSITATEAEIRNEGKLVPFAPISGNLQTELFKPVIHRVFSILMRHGELPQAPAALAEDGEYKVEFVSKIALSMKKIESLAWLQTEAALANMAQLKPDIMDNFDLDAVSRDIAAANGANPKWIRSARDRDQDREARAQVMQEQEQASRIAEAAKAMGNNLTKSPEYGSPLYAITNNQGV